MIQLAVFDLDGTLAPVGESINSDCVKLLKQIEDTGMKIAISSGKSIFYQIGMIRQVGLKDPILIGENGILISFGAQLPPDIHCCVSSDAVYFLTRNQIRDEVLGNFGSDVWLQPNEVMLTIFFKNAAVQNLLRNYFSSHQFENATIYEHVDSFDIVPKGIDKRTALEFLSTKLGIGSGEMIAVGDGINDIPMFEYCEYSIGVDKLDTSLTTFHFSNIKKALKHIIGMAKDGGYKS